MSKRCALIVENDQEDVKKIQTLLDSRGIDFDWVDSALAARTKLKEKKYSFLILDLDLGTGTDDGKFLLDTMLKENLLLPTIIVSNAGFLPSVIALRGKYEFVIDSIDKKHLPELLDNFDKAIKQSQAVISSTTKINEPTQKAFNSVGNLIALLIAFLIIIGAFVVTANLVSPWLFSIVAIATILVLIVILVFNLREKESLSEAGFLEILGKILKSLPILRNIDTGKNSEEK